jgi:DNA-binding NarL/FixJ family response regulator
MTDFQSGYRPDTIRVLLAVATESLADEIKMMVQDANDIEIVAVVTSTDDLLPKVQEKYPHVVCIDAQLDEKWDKYAKAVSMYSLQVQDAYDFSGKRKKWQLKRLHNSAVGKFYLPRLAPERWRQNKVNVAMKRIHITVMSPDDGSELLHRMLQAGVHFHLLMPLHKEQFITTMYMMTTYYLSDSIIEDSE